jgi:hypothetical protein
MSCKHSDIFGRPTEGAHRHRVGGLAAVDLLMTGAAAFLFTRFALGGKDMVVYLLVFLILIVAGVLAHEAFCVDTRFNAFLFRRPWHHSIVGSKLIAK